MVFGLRVEGFLFLVEDYGNQGKMKSFPDQSFVNTGTKLEYLAE